MLSFSSAPNIYLILEALLPTPLSTDKMSSFVPTDQALLQDIIRIQKSQGADIGLQKIYDYLKEEHPLWSFSIKRLRTIRKNHNLAPSPSTASSQKQKDEPNILQMHLRFQVAEGRREHTYTFEKPVPKTYCEAGADRQAAYDHVTRVIDDCEKEILATRPWNCAYCNALHATYMFSYPAVSFTNRPPMVTCYGSVPICFAGSLCYADASQAREDAVKTSLRNSRVMEDVKEEQSFLLNPIDS